MSEHLSSCTTAFGISWWVLWSMDGCCSHALLQGCFALLSFFMPSIAPAYGQSPILSHGTVRVDLVSSGSAQEGCLSANRLHPGVCGPAIPCNAIRAPRGLRSLLGVHKPDRHAQVVWQGEGAVAPQPAHPRQAQGQGRCAGSFLPPVPVQITFGNELYAYLLRHGHCIGAWAVFPPTGHEIFTV